MQNQRPACKSAHLYYGAWMRQKSQRQTPHWPLNTQFANHHALVYIGVSYMQMFACCMIYKHSEYNAVLYSVHTSMIQWYYEYIYVMSIMRGSFISIFLKDKALYMKEILRCSAEASHFSFQRVNTPFTQGMLNQHIDSNGIAQVSVIL